MAEIKYQGALQGHRNWVTSIATTYEQSNLVVSGSRDKHAMVWDLNNSETPEEGEKSGPGYARRCMTGHNQGVCDTVISSDAAYALTGSQDATMRLWDLNTGKN
jgi:guanine nucleotide-binding protein subunit beta-2-like 1 protein